MLDDQDFDASDAAHFIRSPRPFEAADHYWRVGGDGTRVWSSAKFGYVPSTDPAYEAWATESDTTTPIASDADLTEALRPFGLCLTGPCRTATTYQLMSAFTDAQRAAYPTAVKTWDRLLFNARADAWPETNVKIGRIADALGTSPKAWFDAALGGGLT